MHRPLVLPLAAAGLMLSAAYAMALARSGAPPLTWGVAGASVALFAACAASAWRVLGAPAALRGLLGGVLIGWLAEQVGTTTGWPFGAYTYTGVLGPRIGAVPVCIPLMWFALAYAAYVMANLALWQAPVEPVGHGPVHGVLPVVLAAGVVTAFDLGADPYLVHVVGAWTRPVTDGAWFGRPVQGFIGWFGTALLIVCVLRGRQAARGAMRPAAGWVVLPMGVYGLAMLFQVAQGEPLETRVLAPFALGIPLLCAAAGWLRWRAAGAPTLRPTA